MHQNSDYNIVQEGKINSPLFVVIHGQRLPSGIAAEGARIVTVPMSRDEAIKTADILQAAHDSGKAHATFAPSDLKAAFACADAAAISEVESFIGAASKEMYRAAAKIMEVEEPQDVAPDLMALSVALDKAIAHTWDTSVPAWVIKRMENLQYVLEELGSGRAAPEFLQHEESTKVLRVALERIAVDASLRAIDMPGIARAALKGE